MIFIRRKRIAATKAWHFQPKIPSFQPHAFMVIFASFLRTHGPPLDLTLTFAGKNIVNVNYSDDIYEKKSNCSHQSLAKIWPKSHLFTHMRFWSFLPHLRMLMGDPSTQPWLIWSKMLTMGPVATISI